MNNNITWVVKGTIGEGKKEEYITLMNEMVEGVSKEQGTLAYEWTIAEDNRTVEVYERYADEESTNIHLTESWAKFAPKYLALVDVTEFTVYSDLSPALREAVAGLSPIYMSPIGGFARFKG